MNLVILRPPVPPAEIVALCDNLKASILSRLSGGGTVVVTQEHDTDPVLDGGMQVDAMYMGQTITIHIDRPADRRLAQEG